MNSPWSFTYPDLPVAQKRDLVIEAVTKHRVVIVEGGTGSGKSTQLPKILVEMGVLNKGLLGVTQPRRLAALALTDRLREETGLDDLTGSQIRFHEDMPKGARIKVMTDGVLLQEYRRDPLLRRYDAVILDEAHERSLNIDILLGVGLEICRQRADFKWIVASATLDAERFQNYFASVPGGAALLRVEGRQFPVTIEYLDPGEGWRDPEEDEDHADHAAAGLTPLEAAGTVIRDLIMSRPDDLLCFLPSEKEINELSRELEKSLGNRCVILPLYGRLSPAEQRRVYQSHAKPKVVLATNIAETSLTIPGIAYVVDTGTARIARYHAQTRIQGLPIEKIAQASAAQRAGRAGRVKPGLCIRLYREDDFKTRPEWPEPEILRGNLTNVVLQLLSLKLPVLDFPFLDPPAPAALKGAYRRLQELGAVAGEGEAMELTEEGWRMSRLPVDAALAKILLSAEAMGTLPSAMVVAAGLTVQDPRFLPMDEPERGKAVGLHRRFDDARSDFIALLKLWTWVQREWRDGISQRRLRRLCQDNFLSYLRLREWMDLVEQFSRLLPGKSDPAQLDLTKLDQDALHKAILSGFLAHMARRRANEPSYRLVGDKEAFLHPGSGLSKRKPEWIVAGEVRQTSRAFIQRACEIQPGWVEEIAPDAVKRSYTEVAWNPERGFVEATERVSYRSFILRQDRRVDYARIEPEECAEIFWREGVLRAADAGPFPFLQANQAVLASLERHENRIRRRGLAPDEDALLAFYRERAPGVNSRVTLKRFLEASPANEKALQLRAEDFETEEWRQRWQSQAQAVLPKPLGAPPAISPAGHRNLPGTSHPLDALFPETLRLGEHTARVSCRFDFGQEIDGVSLEAPLGAASACTVYALWQALPGWRLWVLSWWAEKLAAKESIALEKGEGDLLRAWQFAGEAMADQAGLSPILALSQALKDPAFAAFPAQPVWPVAWPPHLKLRLYFTASSGRRLLLTLDPGTCEAERLLQLSEALHGREASAKPWEETLILAQNSWGENPPPLVGYGLRFAPCPWPESGSPTHYLWRREGAKTQWGAALATVLSREAAPQLSAWDPQERLASWLRRRFETVAAAAKVPHDVISDTKHWSEWLARFWLPSRFAGLGNCEECLHHLEKEWKAPKVSFNNKAAAKTFKDLQPLHAAAGGAESAAAWLLFLGSAALGPEAMLRAAPYFDSGADPAPGSWVHALQRLKAAWSTPATREALMQLNSIAGAASLALEASFDSAWEKLIPENWTTWEKGLQGNPVSISPTATARSFKAEAESLRSAMRTLALLPQHWPQGWSEALDRFGAGQADASIQLKLLAYAAREGLKRQARKINVQETVAKTAHNSESLKDLRNRFKKLG